MVAAAMGTRKRYIAGVFSSEQLVAGVDARDVRGFHRGGRRDAPYLGGIELKFLDELVVEVG